MMKRLIASALILGAVSGFGLVGCSETTKEESKTVTEGPGGKAVETTSHEIKTSGENPPTAGDARYDHDHHAGQITNHVGNASR